MQKTIAITGCTGQIGSILTQKCLDQGYKVFGLKRRTSSSNTQRIDHLIGHPNLELIYGDITDYSSIIKFVNDTKPDYFINCAAQSHVKISWDVIVNTMEATGNSVVYCLEALKEFSPHTHFVQLSSSEQFGSTPPVQSEESKFAPRSIYAVSKLFGHYATIHYREMGLFASTACCFNSESKFRGENFLPKKCTKAVARIKLGLQDKLYLGNLSAKRSFNSAYDVADALLLIANADKPDDYVVGHNPMVSIKEFVSKVFAKLDMNWEDYVEIDPKYYRATEVDALEPCSDKLKQALGWTPKYSLNDIIDEMLEYDLEEARKEKLLKEHSK